MCFDGLSAQSLKGRFYKQIRMKGQTNMKKTWYSLKTRVTAMLLTLICLLGLIPATAFAASADTIKLERFGMSGVSYQSASLGRCTLHQM